MHELRPSLRERGFSYYMNMEENAFIRVSKVETERNIRKPTVYTLIVDRSFVSVLGGNFARAGSSARATWRNCSPKSATSAPGETLSGPSVPCVGPTSGTWYVSVYMGTGESRMELSIKWGKSDGREERIPF